MTQDTEQNKEIGNLKKDIVGWKVFVWAMGVILALFGMAFASIASISSKVENMNVSYTEIKTQLAQIQTDLVWIKDMMNDNK